MRPSSHRDAAGAHRGTMMSARYHALPGSPTSLWLGSTPELNLQHLAGELEVDVAVVGGGIAGLTTAMLLHEAGKRVAV